jgi:predicted DNA-binding protein (UPF0251 family)
MSIKKRSAIAIPTAMSVWRRIVWRMITRKKIFKSIITRRIIIGNKGIEGPIFIDTDGKM